MLKIILLIIGIIISFSSFASEDIVTPPNEKVKAELVNENLTKNTNFEEDAILYKLLYENSKSANDSLISVIYSTLAIVIAFLIALFSAQFFFNLKLNKEEISLIRSELDKKISDSKTEFITLINTLYNEKESNSRSEFNLYKDQIDKNLDVRFSNEAKSLELTLGSVSKEIKFVDSSLKRRIDLLEIDLEKNVGDVWKLRGVKANALSRYIRTASLRQKNGYDLKLSLTDIVKSLNDETDLHEVDKNSLDILIKDLPGKFESHKDAIIAKLSTLRIYKFVDDPLHSGKRIEKTIRQSTAQQDLQTDKI